MPRIDEDTTAYAALARLGFSQAAIDCYQSLDQDGGTTVTELAKRLNRPRTALYRVLKQLETQGFVKKLEPGPVYFYAEPLDKALENLADHQRRAVVELLKQQRARRN